MACFPPDSWLCGHWVGCFLPQALDWIQETGEFYLSTHTSTGESPEETQELLKEYGEFRGPAKVGSTPGPPQLHPAPRLTNCTLRTGEQPLAENASPQWLGGGVGAQVGSCPLKPKYPKNGSCWAEPLKQEASAVHGASRCSCWCCRSRDLLCSRRPSRAKGCGHVRCALPVCACAPSHVFSKREWFGKSTLGKSQWLCVGSLHR